MKPTIVADVMTQTVVTARPDDTFKHMVELMMNNFVGALPIVDQAGRLVGMVSRTDLIDKELQTYEPGPVDRWLHRSDYEQAAGLTAADVLSKPVVTIAATEPLAAAARSMARHHVTHLPVVDANGALVGIVARADLLKTFLISDVQIKHDVEHDVLDHELWLNPRLFTVTVKDGVVTISGELERRSLVPIVTRLIEALDGVVGVVNHLTYRWDDVEPQVQAFRDPAVYRR
jgi:CBS domain-containing protein